jgi:L-ascorbate metabolism protein UlaG (beta-lactamase superfamily)
MICIRLPKFGSLSKGERLDRINASPHYRGGKFQNIYPLPESIVNNSQKKSLWEFFFPKGRAKPNEPLPIIKSDLKNLKNEEIIWFGHSTFLFRLNDRNFLIDPVFSSYASPLPFLNRAFLGTRDLYTAKDLPKIDYLIISHDHWDHLDYKTVISLRPKVTKVICALGVGAHFERWGYPKRMLLEGEWGDTFTPEEDIKIGIETAQHFAGRAFKWYQSMWASFVIQVGTFKVFYSGDGGYERHFKKIGEKWGGFDLAILEDGQYDIAWKTVHMMPEECILASRDLNAQRVITAHNSKFRITYHNWDDPLIRARAEAKKQRVRLITPLIGQVVTITDDTIEYEDWWSVIK